MCGRIRDGKPLTRQPDAVALLYLPRLPLDRWLAGQRVRRGHRHRARPSPHRELQRPARRLGIAIGDEASAAQAIAPGLRLLPRSPEAERTALEGVARGLTSSPTARARRARDRLRAVLRAAREISGSSRCSAGSMRCARGMARGSRR